mmetsp:Transcript_6733/g.20939  ORF Transcript_6733/g.20939 Transcript_6733/m.20939 type:complete len:159 (+) Transcript_6733:173-649(+)
MSVYLTFGPESQGTLFSHFSATPVAGALACFEPRKKVPAFKFKQNGGRSEIIREMSGGTEGKKRYYSGFASFVKLAKSFDGVLTLYSETPLPKVDIYTYDSAGESHVSQIKPDTPTSLNGAQAVGVVPHPSACFAATMSPLYFAEIANHNGVGLALVV